MSVAMGSGAGMLALPSIFKMSGMIPAIFLIIFGGCLSYIGLVSILYCMY